MIKAEELKKAFLAVYPESQEPAIARAPGRINLLGEHVDYNGLPVLPMTMQREIRVAFTPRRDDLICLHNHEKLAFPPVTFRNGGDIPASETGAWDNYCKASVQALNRHFTPTHFPGMNLYVAGDIPLAAGLSSSSALVVACALAYLAIIGKQIEQDIGRLELAGLLAQAEHYVGTRGGGMDQAVILLGTSGGACMIDFFPLRVERAPLFPDHVFVACNSLVKVEKTGNALHRYNEGPLTSRLICALIEKTAQEQFDRVVRLERLADLWYGPLCLTHSEIAELIEQTFPTETISLEESAARLGMTVGSIRERWIGDLLEPAEGFHLKGRARHQITEFQRVQAGRDALLARDAATFGKLMDASHESCAHDYRVSCPELDELTACARRCGALGARLTGAGFGGCTVNLVPVDDVTSFVERVTESYYRKRTGSKPLPADTLLPVESNSGAGYLHVLRKKLPPS